MIPFFRARGLRTVLDFGAGALRHTLPLLKAGFEVCAVEFERGFDREIAAEARKRAEQDARFTSLIWPHEYLDSGRRFDIALLCYVIQTMPIPKERDLVLKSLAKKLKRDAYVLYMSRYNQGARLRSPRSSGSRTASICGPSGSFIPFTASSRRRKLTPCSRTADFATSGACHSVGLNKSSSTQKDPHHGCERPF
jgi:hypothetical protein